MKFITIDPGLTGTGYAVWEEGRVDPIETAVWVAPRIGDWIDRCIYLAHNVQELCKRFNATECWIEYPIFFNDAGGHMGMSTGDVPKLIFLVGCMAVCVHTAGTHFKPVTVREWKGQMSKDVVKNRIIARLGEEECRRFSPRNARQDHDWDAVGMGLWRQKLLTLKSKSTAGVGKRAPVARLGRSRTGTSSKKS